VIPKFRDEFDLDAIAAFADGLRQIVWVVGDGLSCEYFNPAWTAFTGLTLEQSVGLGWQLALHPAELHLVENRFKENTAHGLPYLVSYRLRSVDDRYRLFTGAMFPVRDTSGAVRKWIGIVDEPDPMERANDRFKVLADALPMLVWTTDREDRLTFVNHAWYEYTGLGVGSLIEERNALVHPEDLGRLMHALRSGAVEVEFRFRRRSDGTYRWHLLRWVRTEMGDEMPFSRIGTAVDIQDRHVAQIERERQLRVIAEAVPNIVWSTRADGVQDYVNSAMAEYVGRKPEETMDQSFTTFVHPDDLAATVERWKRSFETGEAYEHRYRLRRHDGAYRWFLARGSALRDASGQITRWFGTATDIDDEMRSNAILAASESHYRMLAEAMPNIAWSVRGDGVQDYVNDAWYRYTGLRTFSSDAYAPEDREAIRVDWERSFQSGEPFEREMRIRRRDGVFRWFLSRALPLRDQQGRVVRWFGTATDIDDQKRAELQQSYLAALGNIINETWSVDVMIERITKSAVPQMAQWCAIELNEGKRTAQSSAGAVDLDAAQRFRAPLSVRGETIGTLLVARTAEFGTFDEGDAAFFAEVAHRTALAIKNAELYEREHRVSQALQSASLPKTLPAVPWMETDAVYVPGSGEAQIGGDWYDAFRLPDGRLVFSIGDVAGSGLAAAVTMSNMRQIIRGTAQVHADPVLMLNAADRALRIEDPERFVTAFVAVLSPVTGIMTYASAGHPPPYIRHASGEIDELIFSDLPLGLRERHYLDAGQIQVRADDVIVFYTDGLTESTRDLEAGVAALREAIADPDFARAARPAEYLQARLLPQGARDDVAIMTVRMLSDDLRARGLRRWIFPHLDSSAAQRLRREFREALHSRGATSERIEFAELVLGELVGNAARHAPGSLEVILDFSNRRPVLHVIDEGPGFERAPMLPLDLMSESGRGLYIVAQATMEFSVMRRRPHGSHARAVLL